MHRYLKVNIIGDRNVGKSSIIQRKIDGTFDKNYIPTMGISVITLSEKHINLWDHAGDSLSDDNVYYNDSDACILVFDLTSIDSFRNAIKWLESYESTVLSAKKIVLCGNKYDLIGPTDEINDILQRFEQKNEETQSGLKLILTSAKTGHNIEEMFAFIATS